MDRIKNLYIRHDGIQIPVYVLAGSGDVDELERRIESGETVKLKEYTQFGLDYDLTHGVFIDKEDNSRYAIMVISEGGAIKRALAGKKRGKK